jgi:SpoIIAA-like
VTFRWEIIHEQKLVQVVAEGVCTVQEMEEHFDALVVADAMHYAKLFDASKAIPDYSDHDAMMLSARLVAYTEHFKSGPLAVFGESEFVRWAYERFVNLSPSRRPVAMFKTEPEARAWLVTHNYRLA